MCNTFIMISCHYSGYEVKDGQKARAREREREREKRKDDGTRTRRGPGVEKAGRRPREMMISPLRAR